MAGCARSGPCELATDASVAKKSRELREALRTVQTRGGACARVLRQPVNQWSSPVLHPP